MILLPQPSERLGFRVQATEPGSRILPLRLYSAGMNTHTHVYTCMHMHTHTPISILLPTHFKVNWRLQYTTHFFLEIKRTCNKMHKFLVYICSVLSNAFTIVIQVHQDTEQLFSIFNLYLNHLERDC